MIRILAVGKKHEAWIETGVSRYQKRLRGTWRVTWDLVPHSSLEGQRARQEESERLRARLRADDYVIMLDETGRQLDSPALAKQLATQMANGRPITVIIGGAYGVSAELLQRANLVWSLSPLVFPHQLVRLILIEQLYRSSQITSGHPYHHQ